MLRSVLSSCVVAALVWSTSLQGPIAVAATNSAVAIGAIETAGKAEYDLDIATEYTPAHETTSLTNNNANFKSELLALVNRERAKSNLPLVCLNSKLSSAAQFHASDMATRNYFSHTGWNGSSFSQRIAQTGFSSGWRGEIIAAGQPNASAAMDTWMKSEGHRNIILGANYRFLGAGYAYNATARFRHYWVQTFASSSIETCI